MRYTAAFEAIGVTNEITVADPETLPDALRIGRAHVAAFDDACSRFREDSELAQLNARGSLRVSPLLLDAIHVALDAAAKSGGLVDPTVGRSLRSLGYDRDFEVVIRDGASPQFEVVPASGWQSVVVDDGTSTVHLRAGTELDL